MRELRQALLQAPACDDPEPLSALVRMLRPQRGDPASAAHAEAAVLGVAAALSADPDLRSAMQQRLEAVLAARQHRYLYADVGIVVPEGLWSGLASRLGQRLLPPAPHPCYLRDLFGQLFRRGDEAWIDAVSPQAWAALHAQLVPAPDDPAAGRPGWLALRSEIDEAARVLAARVQADACEPDIVRLDPECPMARDAFDRLGAAVALWCTAASDPRARATARREALGAVAGAGAAVAGLRTLLRQHGATAALTQRLLSMDQRLERLRTLLDLEAPGDAQARLARGLRLFRDLVDAQSRETGLRELWGRTTHLVARHVTERAGRTGEHYVAHDRAQWLGMLRAALGAGVIVAAMALVKIGIAMAHLPPLIHALAVSTNYAVGFVLVHLCHCTIATKQPAMTAALIASTIRLDRQRDRGRSHARLADLVVAIVRTQAVAIAGNVLAAFPVSLAIFWGVAQLAGPQWVGEAKADHLLHDLHPWHSLALAHAALTGVFLYLSGVVSGYYDNLAAIARVPARLVRAPWLRWLSRPRRNRVAAYVDENLGALAGNVSFGFMLGMSAFVGLLLGLPIDIRHVTFAAANLAYGGAAVGGLPWAQAAVLALGVALVGLVNLGVSFTLALRMALRANQLRLQDSPRLWALLARRLRRRPLDFVRPPRRARPVRAPHD